MQTAQTLIDRAECTASTNTRLQQARQVQECAGWLKHHRWQGGGSLVSIFSPIKLIIARYNSSVRSSLPSDSWAGREPGPIPIRRSDGGTVWTELPSIGSGAPLEALCGRETRQDVRGTTRTRRYRHSCNPSSPKIGGFWGIMPTCADPNPTWLPHDGPGPVANRHSRVVLPASAPIAVPRSYCKSRNGSPRVERTGFQRCGRRDGHVIGVESRSCGLRGSPVRPAHRPRVDPHSQYPPACRAAG